MDGTDILLHLLGGAALLLWGVRMVRTGMTRAFGASLRHFLGQAVQNRFIGFGAGLMVTMLLQSSTATSVLVASFAARGIVETGPALAVMLGADLGSALIALLLSFRIGWLPFLALFLGVAAFLATENGKVRSLARVGIGLGLVLLALQQIVAAAGPLAASPVMAELMGALAHTPLVGFLLAALLTWLLHSSLAIILLVSSFVAAGMVPLPLALALVLGANAGGGIVAAVSTVRAPPAGRRAPFGNLLQRAITALVLLPFIPMVLPFLEQAVPPEILTIGSHIGFNILLALVFLPVTGPMDRLLMRLLPDQPAASDPGAARFLDQDALDTPSVALASAVRETLRVGEVIQAMFRGVIDVLRSDDPRLLKQIRDQDDVVDRLHEAIKIYVTDLAQRELDRKESGRQVEILTFVTNLEHVGDIIDKNLLDLAARKIRNRIQFSPIGLTEIEAFHAEILRDMELAFTVFLTSDIELARRLFAAKAKIRDLERGYTDSHMARLTSGRVDTRDSSALHLDIMRDLKRVHAHVVSVAYPILERQGELAASRLRTRDEEEGMESARIVT
ncbi:MAG TPA: Na/Pi cotransporter family protein [Geminicoccus sp.]|uniref:Na/Pi cotransporter family protein n=1 Tax=Geminicoccus sp. TaxID=2024832 RepID=UPI002E35C365|nr:Na/Pi cotransporter family protein [Geminicoccus sp.]HEX2529339.1 Na/Pi cotransporter family protein [Geminicoccus sp.]